jgi:hypothetical protein
LIAGVSGRLIQKRLDDPTAEDTLGHYTTKCLYAKSGETIIAAGAELCAISTDLSLAYPPFATMEGSVSEMRLSPDGSYLVSSHNEGGSGVLCVWDLTWLDEPRGEALVGAAQHMLEGRCELTSAERSSLCQLLIPEEEAVRIARLTNRYETFDLTSRLARRARIRARWRASRSD